MLDHSMLDHQTAAGTPDLPGHQTGSAVKAVLVYEDSGTGLRAKHCLDNLPDRVDGEAEVARRLYRQDLLDLTLIRDQAAREAASADIIILSFHGNSRLPMAVCLWLQSWLKQKEERPYALGVLLDPLPGNMAAAHPMIAYVQNLIRGTSVDLFHGFCHTPETGLEFLRPELLPPLPIVAEGKRHDLGRHKHWGINE